MPDTLPARVSVESDSKRYTALGGKKRFRTSVGRPRLREDNEKILQELLTRRRTMTVLLDEKVTT